MFYFRVTGLFLASLIVSALSACAQSNPSEVEDVGNASSKMLWAHFVTWPVDAIEKFDDPTVTWPRYSDRTLLGETVGTRQGLTVANCKRQIEAARKYGIDGFAVDIPNSKHYVSSMRRVYKAAEGTDFKVALCVDGWNRGERSVEQSVRDLVRFFEAYGTHPNNYYIDGKPVIYIYKTQVSLETSRQIVEGLKAEGFEAYWLVQPQRETAGFWESDRNLDEHLEVFDGLYDFGLNGYSQEQMTLRLQNGRRAIKRNESSGLLVAGITPGYAGAHNAYYRPAYGTGTMRDNWRAAIDADADWVCITTWNDYTESTQFEPAVWGRDVRLVINQAYMREWRGLAAEESSAEVVLSYKPFVRLGDQWTVEVLNLGYESENARCFVKLTDLQGQPIESFEPVELVASNLSAETLRVKFPGVETPYDFQVWSAVVEGSQLPQDEDWQPLFPVSVNVGVMLEMKTLQLRSEHWKGRIHIEMQPDNAEASIVASLPDSWERGGQIELIRNDMVVARKPFTEGLDQCSFSLEEARSNRAEDLYTLRYSFPDNSYGISPSFQLNTPYSDMVTTPVLWRDGDFDETWEGFPPVSRIEEMSVPKGRIYNFQFQMDGLRGERLYSRGTWPVVAVAGGTHWGRFKAASQPKQARLSASDEGIHAMAFDGVNDRVVLQARSLPQDVMTVEVCFRPEIQYAESYLLSDASRALDLGITADGKLFAERAGERVISPVALDYDVWHHAVVSYDGRMLRLSLNGEVLAERPVSSTIRPINSVLAVGCKNKEGLNYSAYFKGAISGVAAAARVLSADAYQLNVFMEPRHER